MLYGYLYRIYVHRIYQEKPAAKFHWIYHWRKKNRLRTQMWAHILKYDFKINGPWTWRNVRSGKTNRPFKIESSDFLRLPGTSLWIFMYVVFLFPSPHWLALWSTLADCLRSFFRAYKFCTKFETFNKFDFAMGHWARHEFFIIYSQCSA